jgi:hypothetical protein
MSILNVAWVQLLRLPNHAGLKIQMRLSFAARCDKLTVHQLSVERNNACNAPPKEANMPPLVHIAITCSYISAVEPRQPGGGGLWEEIGRTARKDLYHLAVYATQNFIENPPSIVNASQRIQISGQPRQIDFVRQRVRIST